jgi:hypothetical protein
MDSQMMKAAPSPALPGDQSWLDVALGESSRNWPEAEQRLWIILAQTNGWKLD